MHYSAIVILSCSLAPLSAQFAERPDLPGSGKAAVDCSGRSIKNHRVRAVHTTDPNQVGGTAYLITRDPFLAYQLGRSLNFREFRPRDGVFDAVIAGLGGPMPDGKTAKITTNNHASCSSCHNLPQGNPGGGTIFSKDSGRGRNAPHYFGAGIMEMLALQVRQQVLARVDTDGDGWINIIEARSASSSIRVRPTPGGTPLDFGNPRLSRRTTGSPKLNNIFRVWYVDLRGRVVPDATEVDGQKTFGYNFEMIVWGWGQGPGRSALNPTNRAFMWDPYKAHSGLEAYDPSTSDDPDGDGLSRPTLSGAVQFPVSHQAPDAGKSLDPLGFSRDDPDGDGILNEISEGDLDLGEWFMLNLPRPAFAGSRGEYRRGVQLMQQMACTSCHVADWQIQRDRRLFDLEVRYDQRRQRLQGKLVKLYRQRGQDYRREFRSFAVSGLFTDFRHHDMGRGFREIDFGGTFNQTWRTPPLWGVGSGFPWGHDGASLSLRAVILRHGGAALVSQRAFAKAGPKRQEQLIGFLRQLVLYDIETLPTDMDGDGKISQHFVVAGQDTGQERFNAEWLLKTPLQIQGMIRNIDGYPVRSFAGVNVDAAYGQNLRLRKDSDGDGWPDVWDRAPRTPGYRDGVR